MLKFLKRRRRTAAGTERNPLEIRDLLEHPQLRAAMGLDPVVDGEPAGRRRRRPATVTTIPGAPAPLTRSAA